MRIPYILLFPLLLIFSCTNQREERLNKKEAALNKKEQQLNLKEKSLEIKEQELKNKLDSTGNSKDSSVFNSQIIGRWDVKMVCIETNCTGSAVGDTKNEQWEIFYQNNSVVANAIVDKKLVRVYKGKFNGKTLELNAQINPQEEQASTNMVVLAQQTNPTRFDGRREINREGGCSIVYSLEMLKQ